MSRKLKAAHKNPRLIEGSFIYCRRHELENNFELFMDNHFMKKGFDADKEFEKILTDIRWRSISQAIAEEQSWKHELTEEEWQLLLQKFGEDEQKHLLHTSIGR
jgi:hypothetical protein